MFNLKIGFVLIDFVSRIQIRTMNGEQKSQFDHDLIQIFSLSLHYNVLSICLDSGKLIYFIEIILPRDSGLDHHLIFIKMLLLHIDNGSNYVQE